MTKTWREFLLERSAHEFSSVLANLPASLAVKVIRLGKSLIDDEDVYDAEGFGRENEPHVTVLFGLHADEADEVQKVLKGSHPVDLTLGATSIFEGERYDVVKLTVDSEGLKDLNSKLTQNCEHTQIHPTYIPHCTLAYVKKGTGKKYTGCKDLAGTKVKIHEVLFSDRNRIKTKIALK